MGRSARRTAGHMLVEALVALFVLSVGLLGIALLHVEMLRASRDALLQTEAMALASDMAERMRARREPDGAFDCGGPCGPEAGATAGASAEIEAWTAIVAETLPGGVTAITYAAPSATTAGAYTIRLGWIGAGPEHTAGLELRVAW